MRKQILDVISQDTLVMKLRLSSITNKNLIDSFCKNFLYLDSFVPDNVTEKYMVMDFSSAYIDEFRHRLAIAKLPELKEFATLMQDKFKKYKHGNYMMRNLLRLYSICLTKAEKAGLSKEEMKRYFL